MSRPVVYVLSCAVLLAVSSIVACRDGSASSSDGAELTHGPFLGVPSETTARVWARAGAAGSYDLVVRNVDETNDDKESDDAVVTTATAVARPQRDFTLSWHVTGLAPDRAYRYEIRRDDHILTSPDETLGFRTAPSNDTATEVRLAFASCANERRFPKQTGWRRMYSEGAETIVLLGDTPYIDTTDLDVQRRRYREFYSVADVRETLRRLPLIATWDDHDFGRNDTDGRLDGKRHARNAFAEYHAQPSVGDDSNHGIYTSFRRGPVEVFLLDTRWFAGTEPSFADPDRTTLLGRKQWKWLRRGLRASTATFKILASGMIWNGAVRPGKTDHWMTYPYERDALFRFIGSEEISGVMLVGGDIHRSRALLHPTRLIAGYDIVEVITSPLANTIIETANQPHPSLIFDAGEQECFLLLTADTRATPPTLVGRLLTAGGREAFRVETTAGDVRK